MEDDLTACILLSTFNGSAYLHEQLESIAKQTKRPKLILIRDDGSSDSTFQICHEVLGVSGLSFEIASGDNLGAASSFRTLMQMGLETGCDVFFFCDQDDIWHERKLEYFCAHFRVGDGPKLVFSRYEIIDSEGRGLGYSEKPRRIGFGNALLENICTGCVCAINYKLLVLASKGDISAPVLHDRWAYIIATAFGEVSFIDWVSVKYRQHSGNVVGVEADKLKRFATRVRRFFSRSRGERFRAIVDILQIHRGSMSREQVEMAEALVHVKGSFRGACRVAGSCSYWRQSRIDDVLWRIAVLTGRI